MIFHNYLNLLIPREPILNAIGYDHRICLLVIVVICLGLADHTQDEIMNHVKISKSFVSESNWMTLDNVIVVMATVHEIFPYLSCHDLTNCLGRKAVHRERWMLRTTHLGKFPPGNLVSGWPIAT